MKVWSLLRQSVAALALFNRLLEPNCFARIFLTPASSKIVLTDPPAITPDPGAEGRIITLAAPARPSIMCGIELSFVNGTETIFLLPSEAAFSPHQQHH